MEPQATPQPATPKQVAEWMNQLFQTRGFLDQYTAATGILRAFGKEHLYKNGNGNWAINKPILAEFRKLTTDTAMWSRSDQRWVKRQPHHPKDRRMID